MNVRAQPADQAAFDAATRNLEYATVQAILDRKEVEVSPGKKAAILKAFYGT